MARDRIHIHELRVDCIIGVYSHERHHPQPLMLDLELSLDTSDAAYSGKIAATCDYVRVANELESLLAFRRYKLLEMAAEELAVMLLGIHPQLSDLRLRLTKPRALEGRARAASIEVQRSRADVLPMRERNEWGEVEILYQSREAGLYLLHIDSGREIPAHYHEKMSELEWLVAGDIQRDGKLLQGYAPRAWPKGRVHRYVNVGERRATLFCCDMPPFVRDDEIVVEERQ